MDELNKKGIEKALEAIKRFTEDPDSIDLDWDYEIQSALERQRIADPIPPEYS